MIVKVYAAMLTEQKPISKQCINELEMDTKKAIFGSNYFFYTYSVVLWEKIRLKKKQE